MLSVGIASWGTVRGLRTMVRRMFSIVEPYGQCRMVADDRGAVSTGERVSFSIEWTVFREYVEPPGLFVLLGGERAARVAVLPKRGAQDSADVDRLRAILDRTLERLQAAGSGDSDPIQDFDRLRDHPAATPCASPS
ncbi:hypothetical protein [Streptomyces yanii]|uniref:YcxB-like protein domain-containing protein n=1 Tax=Streptomyces yanii TaxID=78510 RepID=A0ABV5RJD6_9ACTN